MFIGRLPFGQHICGAKAVFMRLGAKQLAHPIVDVENLFLIGCSPEYLQEHFNDYNFRVKNVWFHTTLPNPDILLRPFSNMPNMYLLEYEYRGLPVKYKQYNHIKSTVTTEIISRVLL